MYKIEHSYYEHGQVIFSSTPGEGARLQSDFARLSQWSKPPEAYLRLLTPLTISKF